MILEFSSILLLTVSGRGGRWVGPAVCNKTHKLFQPILENTGTSET
jgi:hypothetical protein